MARVAKDLKEDKEVSSGVAAEISKDNRAAIEILKRSMNKKYGDGDQVFITDYDMNLEGIPTGSAILDALIGNGGWAEGRVHEIHGQSGSGKSSIVTMTCANALKKHPNKFILYIDAEQAQNFRYMKLLGLDMENDERILFTQVNSAEEAFDIINNAIKTGAFSLIILDSVPAIQTKREMSGDFTQETMAEKARFLSKSIPQLLKPLKRSNTTLIFVNQVRDKMDLWGGMVTPGGRAIPFYSSTRVKVNSTPSMRIKGLNDNYIGQRVEFSVVKNKDSIFDQMSDEDVKEASESEVLDE